MTSSDVVDLYSSLEILGVEIWIDGGWGVDALLGKQSRPHQDSDTAIQQKDLPILRELLRKRGYKDTKTDQARDWNFVLGDEYGREIDVHVIVFDSRRNGIYGPKENGEMYPAASLTGAGLIEGRTVRCISPEWVVKFHSGYAFERQGLSGRVRVMQEIWSWPAARVRAFQEIKASEAGRRTVAAFPARRCCD